MGRKTSIRILRSVQFVQELLMCEESGTVCYKDNGDSIF